MCVSEKKWEIDRERGRTCASEHRTDPLGKRVCVRACVLVCHGSAASTRGPPNSALVGGSHTRRETNHSPTGGRETFDQDPFERPFLHEGPRNYKVILIF